jgi:hypothetical protein
MVRQRKQVPAAGLRHAVAAEADAFEVGAFVAQGADEIGAVDIAARFADAEEDAHADILAREENLA